MCVRVSADEVGRARGGDVHLARSHGAARRDARRDRAAQGWRHAPFLETSVSFCVRILRVEYSGRMRVLERRGRDDAHAELAAARSALAEREFPLVLRMKLCHSEKESDEEKKIRFIYENLSLVFQCFFS